MDGSTGTGDPFLSCLPDTYYTVYILPVLIPITLWRNFNDCNEIGDHNKMCQYELVSEKYRVT